MNNIILYTIDCPKCRILESKLTSKGINFSLCKDEIEFDKLGISDKPFPFLLVNDELLDFSKAIEWMKNSNAN